MSTKVFTLDARVAELEAQNAELSRQLTAAHAELDAMHVAQRPSRTALKERARQVLENPFRAACAAAREEAKRSGRTTKV